MQFFNADRNSINGFGIVSMITGTEHTSVEGINTKSKLFLWLK